MVQFHYARFYKLKARGINCMTIHNSKLALSRSDNSIEIWNITNTPFIERLIPTTLEQDIQGLVWCGNQLFSCDLQGFLNEYNLYMLKTKLKLSVTGEAAYCLDVDKMNKHIAVGTDQGYINIFSVIDEEVLFDKFLDKQEGKILCLKYDTTGKFIVTGSIDVIRIFDVEHGHALHKMSTGRSEKNKPTITWCLTIINDFTIITGDSRGKLTFWDGKVGAQIESYQSHKADILAISVSETEDSIFCAGVDPVISSFTKVNVKDQTHKWVKNIQRRAHDHDVKALVLYKNQLYSGGTDGYLALTYHPPKTLVKYPPLLPYNCVSVSSDRLLLLQYTNYLELWKLGDSEDELDCNQMYRVKNIPKKLVSIERQVKNSIGHSKKEFILCSSMSRNGKWIVYSTINFVNLLQLDYDNNVELKLIPTILTNLCDACTCLGFCHESKELFLATIEGHLIIYDLESKSVSNKLDTKPHITDSITQMTISPKYVITGDVGGSIVAFRKDKIWRFYCKLPKYDCIPTAITINNQNNVVIAYSDNKIAEYILDKKRFSKFSKSFDNKSLDHCRNKHFPIRNITFDKLNENIIILHDDTTIVVIKKDKIPIEEPDKKIIKLDKVLLGKKHGVSTFKENQHLVHLGSVSEKEFVAVEVSPMTLLEGLPPCLKQTSFGSK